MFDFEINTNHRSTAPAPKPATVHSSIEDSFRLFPWIEFQHSFQELPIVALPDGRQWIILGVKRLPGGTGLAVPVFLKKVYVSPNIRDHRILIDSPIAIANLLKFGRSQPWNTFQCRALRHRSQIDQTVSTVACVIDDASSRRRASQARP
jgi:hypothetical protein